MTQKELLSLEHLKIAEVKEGYFLHVHTEDGYFLTSWNERDNVKNYSGAICIYAPIMDNYPDYRIIRSDEHKNLENQKEELEKKEYEDWKRNGHMGATASYLNKTV